jgi:hypothetical protein
MNGRDLVPGGLELDEAVEIGALLQAAGADAVSVSGGTHASRPYAVIPGMSVPRGCYASYGEAFKRRLTIPIMVVGRINTPALAEEIPVGTRRPHLPQPRAPRGSALPDQGAVRPGRSYRPVHRLQRVHRDGPPPQGHRVHDEPDGQP